MKHGLSRLLLPLRRRTRLYAIPHSIPIEGRVVRSRSDHTQTDDSLLKLGQVIKDDFAKFKEHYQVPSHPIVLAHGLLGFDELKLAGQYLPGIHYWRGIREAYQRNGIQVITSKHDSISHNFRARYTSRLDDPVRK